MVKAILSDVCIETQVRVLAVILTGPVWHDIWARLGLEYRTFRDVGLAADTPDDAVWDFCQREQMLLITANRNEDGPDSLETTIRRGAPPRACRSSPLPMQMKLFAAGTMRIA